MSGDTPEELQANMPHLSLAQVYSALAYYHDNCEDVESQIAMMEAKAASIQARHSGGPTRSELLARKAARDAASTSS